SHRVRARLDRGEAHDAVVRGAQPRKAVELRIERRGRLIQWMAISAVRVRLPEFDDEARHRPLQRIDEPCDEHDLLSLWMMGDERRHVPEILWHVGQERARIERPDRRLRRERCRAVPIRHGARLYPVSDWRLTPV